MSATVIEKMVSWPPITSDVGTIQHRKNFDFRFGYVSRGRGLSPLEHIGAKLTIPKEHTTKVKAVISYALAAGDESLSKRIDNPWSSIAGIFKNDDDFKSVAENISKNRKRDNADDNIE